MISVKQLQRNTREAKEREMFLDSLSSELTEESKLGGSNFMTVVSMSKVPFESMEAMEKFFQMKGFTDVDVKERDSGLAELYLSWN